MSLNQDSNSEETNPFANEVVSELDMLHEASMVGRLDIVDFYAYGNRHEVFQPCIILQHHHCIIGLFDYFLWPGFSDMTSLTFS